MRFRSYVLTVFESGLRQQPGIDPGIIQQLQAMEDIVNAELGFAVGILISIKARLLTNAFLRLPVDI